MENSVRTLPPRYSQLNAPGPSSSNVGSFVAILALGAVLGTLLFLRPMDPAARRALPAYLSASLRAEAPTPFRPETGAEQRDEVASLFRGRTATFLVRQWGARVLVGVAFSIATAALILARNRRRALAPRLERGGILRNARDAARSAALRRCGLTFAAGLGIAMAVRAHNLGSARIALYPDYLKASVLSESETLSRVVSLDGDGELAWFDVDGGGFASPRAVEEALFRVFGVSAAGVALRTLLQGMLLGAFGFGLVLFVRARRRREFELAEVPIPETKTCYHLLITGSPGSGKSTAIRDLLDQIRARRRRAIVYDLGGEYVEHYFREGYDKLLNPFDERSEHWTPWAEVRANSDYATIASSLFPPGGRDPFWADAAAALFSSTLEALAGRRPSNVSLYKALVRGNLDKLFDLLKDTAAARFLDPRAGVMPGNVLATVGAKLGVFSILDDPKDARDAFSIRSFIASDDDRWLFLSTTEAHARIMKPLLSLWCDVAATEILSLPETRTTKVFCILDEVASLQRLPALSGLLERGRKHGASVILGLQAIPQLRDAYGHDAAAALVAQPQTWLVLRSVEPDTARWLEGALGTSEVVESATSVTIGADASRTVSLMDRPARRPLALASEVASLPDFEGFLRLPGNADIFRVRFAPKARVPIAKPFVEKKRR